MDAEYIIQTMADLSLNPLCFKTITYSFFTEIKSWSHELSWRVSDNTDKSRLDEKRLESDRTQNHWVKHQNAEFNLDIIRTKLNGSENRWEQNWAFSSAHKNVPLWLFVFLCSFWKKQLFLISFWRESSFTVKADKVYYTTFYYSDRFLC